MNFALTRVAAAIGMVVVAGSAQAVLTSSNTLSIQNDAAISLGTTSSNSMSWVETGNGPMLDSFFTMGGSKEKLALGTQYSYLYNGADLTLTGATQSNIATWHYYNAPGSSKTSGTGISILSASGDTAAVNMSGLKIEWNGVDNISMGGLAWSAGYTSGVGNVTCTAGSGCAVGSAYTLKYTATVPVNDPSGFGTVKYYLELHGAVGPVPEASTYGMMLAGLGLVGAAASRRKQIRL